MFFVPIQVYSRDRCHFSLVFQKLYEGTPGFEPGTSRTATECSTTELYHRSPLHTDSIISLQTRSGCLSTVTMFFVPSQVYSRDQCHFFLVCQKLYKGTTGFEPGTSLTAAECSTTELYPRCIQIQYHHCKHVQVVLALLQCFFCSESSVLSRSMSFFSSLSKIIRGDTRIRTRDLSDCSRMVYHWAISPLHTDSIPSLQTREGCLSTVTMFFVPSQVYSRDRCHFSLVFQKLYKGTPGFKQGTSWTAAECSTTELYPRCIQTQNITANTLRLFEHCYNVFCSESSVLSRSMSFFSSLLKIIQGSARVRTRDLSDCSRMLYHWAISPLHAYLRTSPQTRAGCLSTVTMFFVPIQVYSRDRCHFSLVFQKLYEGTPGFEPGTSRTATECSTTELYHRSPLHTDSIISLQTRSGCLSTVTMFFVPSQVYSRDQCHFFLVCQKLYNGTTGFEPGTSLTAAECSTTELYPRCIQIQYHHCKHVQVVLALLQCFFVPSQVFSRDRCHFSLVFQKLFEGTPGFEPGTSRTAAEWSTTELYPRCIQIQYHHCKHAQVVWALLQCFLFRVKCTLGIDVIFL